ncbi:hypothetical protein AYJ54_35785 [Bradyrhizobium centrolobii]|uniref:WYL domain-containing protein n=1 Tax=Bradyrhizobium centrolobii TaxID=1505087 RepID=A0A176Y9E3_9BRAD|nr:hypothetical protein [Bradyrhizobium centrolobii]OAE97448.1 hypothetical protein AYJ54_35785 [Bradyrhizobium centrolobii]
MSSTYELIARAIIERQQVLCFYQGHPRAICPAILGHTNGQEYTLAFQFAGGSSKGLPPEGEWKCFKLAEMSNVELRIGEWHEGSSHRERQQCVKVVDLDVNPFSPYEPRRRVQSKSRSVRPKP